MHLRSYAFSHRRTSPWTADAYRRRRIPSAKALVRAGVVGAGGVEPSSSSVSAPTSHYRPVHRRVRAGTIIRKPLVSIAWSSFALTNLHASCAATLVPTSALLPVCCLPTRRPRPSGPQSESPTASSQLPELKSRQPAVPLNRRLPLGPLTPVRDRCGTDPVRFRRSPVPSVGRRSALQPSTIRDGVQSGCDRGCHPNTKYEIGTTPAELTTATTAAHSHFGPCDLRIVPCTRGRQPPCAANTAGYSVR